MREMITLTDLLNVSKSIGPRDIDEYLESLTEQSCPFCGKQWLKKAEALNGRCEECREASVDEEHSCQEPDCHHGWHWRKNENHSQGWNATSRCSIAHKSAVVSKFDSGYSGGVQTFKSFNRGFESAAYDAALDWAENASGQDTLSLVRSDRIKKNVGCGKTHLLRAAGREMAKRGLWVETVSSGSITDVVRMRASFTERSIAEARVKRWSASDVLILDDVGNEETSGPITGSFLAHLFDERLNKPLGFASNLTCDEIISRYGDAMASRFLGGSRKPVMRGSDFRSK